MSGKNTLSDAELTVMKLLWRAGEPLPSAEIAKRLEPETGWSFSTVSTLLGRMAEKQAISHEKRGKAYYYRPLIAEDDYKKRETRSFLGKLFNGRASDLLAALVACDEVTADDIEEIRERFGLK